MAASSAHTDATTSQGINPVFRGWFAYATAFYPSAVIPLCERVDRHLVRWARWKYKRLERSARRAREWLGASELKGTRAVRALAVWRALSCSRMARAV